MDARAPSATGPDAAAAAASSPAARVVGPADPSGGRAMPMFAMQGIGKRFGDFAALDGIDLDFAQGEIHCLLGENGAGKSTLCNLIFGIHAPTSGTMSLNGAAYAPAGPADALRSRIAMVHQHFSLSPDLSVIDNLLLGRGFGPLARRREADRLTALGARYGLALEPFRRVEELSVGERQRVEIVKCLMRAPRLLILDEPSAVLLPQEIEALLRTCREVAESGCGVVLVTHKLTEISDAADRVTVLRHGRVATRSTRPAAEMEALVQAMIGRERGGGGLAAIPRAAPRDPAQPRAEVMQADGLCLTDAGGATRLDHVTFTVDAGEIVGIAGVEGNGQSELGEILAGLSRPTAGRWFAAGQELTRASAARITAAGVGIVPEDRHRVAMAAEMSLADNMMNNRLAGFTRAGLLDRAAMRSEAAALMQRFDVRAAGPGTPMGRLSGGNQQKAVLARELTTPGLKFLLAAQPTRGLDVGAVEAVYRLIRAACDGGAGVLLISSELDELLAVADRILVMYRGRIVSQRAARPGERAAIGAMMAGQGAA